MAGQSVVGLSVWRIWPANYFVAVHEVVLGKVLKWC